MQQDARYIRGILMRVASGLFSWSMATGLLAFSSRQFTIKHGIVKLSINNHIVRLVHKNHIIRTCLMYHAACKVEFQPFTRSYSQLTFFNFFIKSSMDLLFVRFTIFFLPQGKRSGRRIQVPPAERSALYRVYVLLHRASTYSYSVSLLLCRPTT